MRTLLSLLLIPFFVLGQGLPHSHAGTGIVEPSDHAARPHVHLFGGHSHHDHHDGCEHHHADEVTKTEGAIADGVGSISAPLDHDSDAIYLAESSSIGRVSTVPPVDFASAPNSVDWCVWHSPGFSGPSYTAAYRLDAGPPIYLLVNSFRL